MRREQSAGGVVHREIDGALHVLLIRDPYRNWGLPKGHVEAGEAPADAALREVREETGLRELELGVDLGTIDWYFRAGGDVIHKYCRFYLMRSPAGEPVPEEAEGITACRWVPVRRAPAEITYANAREVLRTAVRQLTGRAEPDEASPARRRIFFPRRLSGPGSGGPGGTGGGERR